MFLQDSGEFKMSSVFEEGRERCPYDPAKGYTGLLIGKEIMSTSFFVFFKYINTVMTSCNPTFSPLGDNHKLSMPVCEVEL